MRSYSQACHYVVFSQDRETRYPCHLDRDHKGPHADGYGHEHLGSNWWLEVSTERQYEELWERVTAAGRQDLLEGLEP